MGKILSFSSVQSKYGKGKVQKNCVIASEHGERTVWESAGTTVLFTGEDFKGKTVCIVYLGDKVIPGRKLPMHDFAVGVKNG